MATITKGYTFGATETVTSAKLATLVDSATIANIVAADISSSAITDIKINDVSGAKFTSLSSISGGAGIIPIANIPTIIGSKLGSLSSTDSGAGVFPIANIPTRFQFVTTTFDMSTTSGSTKTVTGAGFTPTGALIFAMQASLTSFSIGWSDLSNHYAIFDQTAGAGTVNNWGESTNKSIVLQQSGGSQELYFSSFNSDGGVLTNTKITSPSGAILARLLIFFLR